MTIRRLVASDTDQYRSLMLQAYENHPDAFSSSVPERSAAPLSFWQARLTIGLQPSTMVIGAFKINRLIGVAGISFGIGDKTSHKARVFGMYVDNTERGSGIASMLLREVIHQATLRQTVRVLQLTVSEGNATAKRLYENTGGFKAFGVEPFALKIGDSYVSKVHMWRQI